MANGQPYPYEKRNIDEELTELANKPFNLTSGENYVPATNPKTSPAPNIELLAGLPAYYGMPGQVRVYLDPEELNEPSAPDPELLEKIYTKNRQGELEEIDYGDWFSSVIDERKANRGLSNNLYNRYSMGIRPFVGNDFENSSAPNPELLQGLPKQTALSENVNPAQTNEQTNLNNYRPFEIYQPQKLLTPREYEARSQIVAAKTNWKANQEAIEKLEKLKLEKDKDGKKIYDENKIQARIDALKAGQKDYADAATVIRNTAGAMGWNMSGMGADDSLDLSTQLLAIDRARGVSELANMPSTAAQKRQVYEQMLDRGVAPHMARAVAESYHDEFRENNIRQLMSGIRVYGTNGDGSLNDFGQMLAGKLYNENPYMYGNVVNGFASPKDIFGVNATLENTQLTQDNANLRTLMNNERAIDIANANILSREGIAKARLEQSERHHQDDMKFKWTALDTKTQLELTKMANAMSRGGGGSSGSAQNKLMNEITDLVELGIKPERAAKMVISKKYDLKEDTNFDKAKNNTMARMFFIEDSMFGENTDENSKLTTLEYISDWRKALMSGDIKNMEYYDETTLKNLSSYLSLCENYCNGKITKKDFETQKTIIFATEHSESAKTFKESLKKNLGFKGNTQPIFGASDKFGNFVKNR